MSFKHFHYEVVNSTQAEALRIAQDESEQGNFWVRANQQTAGRGRMGRAWNSETGNLLCTLCLQNTQNFEQRKALPFIAAIAIYQTLAQLMQANQCALLKLKWPNDVLYAGAKLAGILIEVNSTPNSLTQIVCIGFGVNLAHAPQIEGRNIICLSEMGLSFSTAYIFEQLKNEFETLWANYNETPNFANILQQWSDYAIPNGETLRVHTHDGIKIGSFAGLDNNGALLLQTPNGQSETITAGDVELLG